ncbi:MAG: hypothetical protein IKY26_01105 [Erysipelotrichaceae bacterium]|nr:hypothetical protein [Erysipelotrichaceae bacterium]
MRRQNLKYLDEHSTMIMEKGVMMMAGKSELAILVKNQLEALFAEVADALNKDFKRLVNKSKFDVSKAFLRADEMSFLLYLYEYTNYSFLQVIDSIEEDGSINDWCIYMDTIYLYRELKQRELSFFEYLFELEDTHGKFIEFNFTSHDDWKKRIHLYLEHVRSLD